LIFLPSLASGCPSLALRRRALREGSSLSDASFGSSSMALSSTSILPSSAANLWVGRLAGGEGRLPARLRREPPLFLDTVLRRAPAIGTAVTFSPASLRTAATAAAEVAVLDMLFRRVTRWVGLSEEDRIECELLREWLWRADMLMVVVEEDDIEGRCASGLEACCIS